MTKHDLAAFSAVIRHAADPALIVALALELRADADVLRQRAAVEALRGLAEGLRAESHQDRGTVAIVARIASSPDAEGEETCPRCAGRVRWAKDAINGHIHARCEAAGGFAVMQ